jgi:CYTH domain-containing protein
VGCSKRLSSKAAASEEARRTLRYVEPLSEARTMLADFFSILLANRRGSV